eukprot:TRINITY_DN24008_c0_g1_i1.p1 TRINITY_DN24008_c0_g1~~TRINITY_DN24008_c0_g1_i1.p1  ORF type:complete len:367 (+),score=125.31 TRINITY_DN24008_c0_g1_i1:79-1101(+)
MPQPGQPPAQRAPLPGARPTAAVLLLLSSAFIAWHAGLPRTQLGAEPLPNFRGVPTLQLPQLLPALAPTYAAAETGYNVQPMLYYSKEHYEVPTVAVGVYLLLIYAGPRLMKHRAPFDQRLLLGAWNWALSLFSTYGALRTVPHLLYNLWNKSFWDTICVSPHLDWGVGATGLWVQLFIYSKLPELLDTVFIVLHKKDLSFLHWYHHVTVLLYCWHSYVTEAGAGLWFIAMNYSVHAVMYAYFAAAALRLLPPGFPASVITAAQLAQMFVGSFVCAASCYYVLWGTEPCHNDRGNLMWGSIMYLSYFYLFAEFAVKRYILGPRRKAQREPSQAPEAKKEQ